MLPESRLSPVQDGCGLFIELEGCSAVTGGAVYRQEPVWLIIWLFKCMARCHEERIRRRANFVGSVLG